MNFTGTLIPNAFMGFGEKFPSQDRTRPDVTVVAIGPVARLTGLRGR